MSNRTNQNRRKLSAIKRAAQAKSAVSMIDFATDARNLLEKVRGKYPHGLITVTCCYKSWAGDPARIEKPEFQINAAGNNYHGGIICADSPREALAIFRKRLSVPKEPNNATFDTNAEIPF